MKAEAAAKAAHEEFTRVAKEYKETQKRWYTAVDEYDKLRDRLIEQTTGRAPNAAYPAYLNAFGRSFI